MSADIRGRRGRQRTERCQPKKVGTVLPLQPSVYCRNWRGCITSKTQNVLDDLQRRGLFFFFLFFCFSIHQANFIHNYSKASLGMVTLQMYSTPGSDSHSTPIAGRGGARLRVCAAQCRHSPPAVTERSLYGRVQSVCAEGLTEGRERDVERRDKECKCVWGGCTPLYSWLHRSAARAEGSPDERNEGCGLVVIWWSSLIQCSSPLFYFCCQRSKISLQNNFDTVVENSKKKTEKQKLCLLLTADIFPLALNTLVIPKMLISLPTSGILWDKLCI